MYMKFRSTCLAKRVVLFVFLLTFALATVSSAKPLKFTVILRGTMERATETKELIRESLAQLNQEIELEDIWITNPNAMVEGFLVRTAAGVPIDLVHLPTPHVPLSAFKGLLEPIDPFIQKDPSFSLRDYYPPILSSISYNGTLYALPMGQAGPLVLYYNADLFNEVGIPYPTMAWSWEREVPNLGSRLVADRNGDGVIDRWAMEKGSPRAADGYEATFVWAEGGDMWSADGTEFLMTSEPAQRALAFLTDLYRRNLFGGAGIADWKNQSYGMVIQGGFYVNTLRAAGGFTWDAAPVPTYRGERYSLTWAESPFSIPKSSTNKQIAYHVLKHLGGQAGQKAAFQSGLAVPVIRSLVASPLFLKDSPPDRHVFLDAMTYTRARPSDHLPWWGEFRPKYSSKLTDVFDGTISPLEGMTQLKTEFEAALRAMTLTN